MLNNIQTEIDGRDLSTVETSELINLFLKINDKVKAEIINPEFKDQKEIQSGKRLNAILDKL